jgi:hypothetical protein
LPQSRFVTYNDVRKILRSVVENVPLDSALGREAFHADVDHDGRYYRVPTIVWKQNSDGKYLTLNNQGVEIEAYQKILRDQNGDSTGIAFYGSQVELIASGDATMTNGTELNPENVVIYVEKTVRGYIPIRSADYVDDLPTIVSRVNQLHFEADENDAMLISAYLKAKVPSLPWVYDTMSNGKVTYTERLANNLKFGTVENINGIYKIPVHSNGASFDGMNNFFEMDANIISVELASTDDAFAFAEFNDGRFVFTGTENYTSNEPFAYVYVETAKNEINVSNVRFNDENQAGTTIKLEENKESVVNITSSPSVFDPSNTVAKITINIATEGFYSLNVYDIQGNVVETLFEGNLTADQHEFNFAGTDTNGNLLPAGMYLYRLNGSELNMTTKAVINR